MTLSSNICNWSEEARYIFFERLNICELEGDIDYDRAYAIAEDETRKEFESR